MRVNKRLEKRDGLLLAALFVLAVAYLGRDAFRSEVPGPWYEEKRAAAQLAQRAMQALQQEKIRRGLRIDPQTDVNRTGMIGVRWSGMTTTLGVLEAKRTTTHPDFAALLVGLLKDCGVQRHDRVAVNLSASFPALNVSVLSALEVLELRPVVISSLGASMWGANEPAWTWLDMERHLLAQGMVHHGSVAVSLGGAGDVGKDMEDEVRAALREKVRASPLRYLEEADGQKNQSARLDAYFAPGEPVCFVNAGGNLAASGAAAEFVARRPGLLLPERADLQRAEALPGLVSAFLARGIPVVHLLDIKALALEYGLPFDPVPLPEPGSSGVFREVHYHRLALALILALAGVLLGFYVRAGRLR